MLPNPLSSYSCKHAWYIDSKRFTCGYVSNNPEDIQRHSLVHSNTNKSYQCLFCKSLCAFLSMDHFKSCHSNFATELQNELHTYLGFCDINHSNRPIYYFHGVSSKSKTNSPFTGNLKQLCPRSNHLQHELDSHSETEPSFNFNRSSTSFNYVDRIDVTLTNMSPLLSPSSGVDQILPSSSNQSEMDSPTTSLSNHSSFSDHPDMPVVDNSSNMESPTTSLSNHSSFSDHRDMPVVDNSSICNDSLSPRTPWLFTVYTPGNHYVRSEQRQSESNLLLWKCGICGFKGNKGPVVVHMKKTHPDQQASPLYDPPVFETPKKRMHASVTSYDEGQNLPNGDDLQDSEFQNDLPSTKKLKKSQSEPKSKQSRSKPKAAKSYSNKLNETSTSAVVTPYPFNQLSLFVSDSSNSSTSSSIAVDAAKPCVSSPISNPSTSCMTDEDNEISRLNAQEEEMKNELVRLQERRSHLKQKRFDALKADLDFLSVQAREIETKKSTLIEKLKQLE